MSVDNLWDRSGTVSRGVVAVVFRQGQFLVIRRSQHVVAPGMICFPGGGVLVDEEESTAVRRELQEELSVMHARPQRRVWQSRTPRGIHLGWWLTDLPGDSTLTPNPAEVEQVFWESASELLRRQDLLDSNRLFFEAWARSEFSLEHGE